MKKLFLSFLLVSIIVTSFSTIILADSTTEEVIITPKASSVFDSYGSSINSSAYGGDCTLMADGNGSIQIILQKQNEYSKAWYTYDSQNYTKTFTNTSVCAFGKYYTMPVGKFRCKTIVTATVNGVTETKTVFSPELTIYSAD